MVFNPINDAHRRYNPLIGEWIIVSAQRLKRPWQGQTEEPEPEQLPSYEPNCYLCPDNHRAGGKTNPAYQETFVFRNDFSVLMDNPTPPPADVNPLFQADVAQGECRVICFSPRHNVTLAEMTAVEIKAVIEVWAKQTAELGQQYRWVQLFENKGAMMGCSNPHPHGQIWGQPNLPTEGIKEDQHQRTYYETYQRPLLLDYADAEVERQQRVVVQNQHWMAVVPYWAAWPFETLLLPRQHTLRLSDISENQKLALAAALKELLVRYDNLFNTSFPYAMGWHGAPFIDEDQSHWQLHAHFYPPLLRSATVRKFMVGYEMLGELQRDLTAEQAAERLIAVSPHHYKQQPGH